MTARSRRRGSHAGAPSLIRAALPALFRHASVLLCPLCGHACPLHLRLGEQFERVGRQEQGHIKPAPAPVREDLKTARTLAQAGFAQVVHAAIERKIRVRVGQLRLLSALFRVGLRPQRTVREMAAHRPRRRIDSCSAQCHRHLRTDRGKIVQHLGVALGLHTHALRTAKEVLRGPGDLALSAFLRRDALLLIVDRGVSEKQVGVEAYRLDPFALRVLDGPGRSGIDRWCDAQAHRARHGYGDRARHCRSPRHPVLSSLP